MKGRLIYLSSPALTVVVNLIFSSELKWGVKVGVDVWNEWRTELRNIIKMYGFQVYEQSDI